MYLAHFHLERMPFDNTPDPRFFFMTSDHEEALAALRYGVAQERGFTAVTGLPGCGKTLLGQMLVASLRLTADVVTVTHTPDDAHDLLTTLCRAFGVRFRAAHTTGELVDRFRHALIAQRHEGRLAVVVLDEAQNLSLELLEHLRMLGNIELDTAKLLQFVLLGQPELTALLLDPRLDQLRQRIFCWRTVEPLSGADVRRYIDHRLRIAGAGERRLFSDDACDLVHERARGIPRMINQIADNSLLVAYSASRNEVDRQTVADALQQMMRPQFEEAPRPTPQIASTIAAPPPPPSEAVASPTAPPEAPPPAWLDRAETLVKELQEAAEIGARISGRLEAATRAATQRCIEIDQQVQVVSAGAEQADAVVRQCVQERESLKNALEQSASAGRRIERLVAAGLTRAREAVSDVSEAVETSRREGRALDRTIERCAERVLDCQTAEKAAVEAATQAHRAGESLAHLETRTQATAAELADQLENAGRVKQALQDEADAARALMTEIQTVVAGGTELLRRLAHQDGVAQATAAAVKQQAAEGEALVAKLAEWRRTIERRAEGAGATIDDCTALLTQLGSERDAAEQTLQSMETRLEAVRGADTRLASANAAAAQATAVTRATLQEVYDQACAAIDRLAREMDRLRREVSASVTPTVEGQTPADLMAGLNNQFRDLWSMLADEGTPSGKGPDPRPE